VSPRRSTIPPLGVAACLGGLVITGALVLFVPAVQRRDHDALLAFADLDRPHTSGAISHVAHMADPMNYALFTIFLVVIAILRGGRRLALSVGAVLIGSAIMAQGLKHALAHTRADHLVEVTKISTTSWPSGHSTAAMALALSAVLVAAPRWRPLVGLAAAAFALAVGFSTVALEWHYPSDVLGGFFVSGLWASMALVWLRAERELEARDVKRIAFTASAGFALATGAVIATIRPAFALFALAIATLALALVAAASSTSAPRPR
jgi:membrane-associated phospholipid phosphatase